MLFQNHDCFLLSVLGAKVSKRKGQGEEEDFKCD